VHEDIQRVLIPESEIVRRLDSVAREIHAGIAGRPFTVVGVLDGACVFVSDLIRRLPDPIELAFVSAKSYRGGTESGRLELDFLPTDKSIEGRNLLLVDDILDTGRTLAALSAELRVRGAAEVTSCVLLDKPARRVADFDADYRCFEIEDVFVVGYGLDYAGRYRNLPYVGALKPAAVDRYAELASRGV
jgi:hypoxanthine phosphoribosyltransferase